MTLIVIAAALTILSGGITVLIGCSMFKSCARRDLRHDGHTPGMFHVLDPYIGGLLEDLYRAGNTRKRNAEDNSHV